jgi:hypothetical protein
MDVVVSHTYDEVTPRPVSSTKETPVISTRTDSQAEIYLPAMIDGSKDFTISQ